MRIDRLIYGQRITIRNYEPTDLDFVTGMWLDPENGKYMSDPIADHVDAAFQRALDTLHESRFGYYMVTELTETGERIGSFSVFPEGKTFDIGYCIHKRHWRSGFGSETLCVMLDWIKAQGGETVTAEVAVENAASNALLQKFGFDVIRRTEFKKYNMDVRFDSFIYAKKL